MFFPEHKNCFMCPTCMRVIRLCDIEKISEAHIIPKAAGGKLKTFICKDCNSMFGYKQDKWFGDILNIANNVKPSIFSTAIKEGYFEIDGEKVNGTWKQTLTGNFSFYIHIDRNSPQQIALINKKFNEKPPEVNLSFPLPILKNQNYISIGYLTAAYLMWFGLLGYSWALQEHLANVRKQIMEPEHDVIPHECFLTIESANWNPWVGLVTLFGDTVPAFGLKKHLVLLPPRDRPNYYNSLKKFESKINVSDIKPLKLPDKPNYGPPLAIAFEDRLIVYATPSKVSAKHLIAILFSKDSDKGKILRPVEEDKFDELKKHNKVKLIEVNIRDYKK